MSHERPALELSIPDPKKIEKELLGYIPTLIQSLQITKEKVNIKETQLATILDNDDIFRAYHSEDIAALFVIANNAQKKSIFQKLEALQSSDSNSLQKFARNAFIAMLPYTHDVKMREEMIGNIFSFICNEISRTTSFNNTDVLTLLKNHFSHFSHEQKLELMSKLKVFGDKSNQAINKFLGEHAIQITTTGTKDSKQATTAVIVTALSDQKHSPAPAKPRMRVVRASTDSKVNATLAGEALSITTAGSIFPAVCFYQGLRYNAIVAKTNLPYDPSKIITEYENDQYQPSTNTPSASLMPRKRSF